jgi:hypothetical protein
LKTLWDNVKPNLTKNQLLLLVDDMNKRIALIDDSDEYHKRGMTSYRDALIKSINDGKFLKEM